MIEFLTITVFMILAAISPGPDFALVTKNSLCYSRKAGCYTALGISFGILFHATYCVLGLGFIIAKSVWLFSIIKYIGAAYLIYLGVKAILVKRGTTVEAESLTKAMTNAQAFWQGFLCNALNPKAIFFFLALFTMIATPNTSIWLQIFYGLEVSLIHLIWFCCLSIALTHQRIQTSLSNVQHYITRVMGGFLIFFGLRIAI